MKKYFSLLILFLFLCTQPMLCASASSVFQLSYQEEMKTAFSLQNNVLTVRDFPQGEMYRYVWLSLIDQATNEEVFSEVAERTDGKNADMLFNPVLQDGAYAMEIYCNDSRYGTFSSYLLRSVVIRVSDGVYSFAMSPVYGYNTEVAEESRVEDSAAAAFLLPSSGDPVLQQLIGHLARSVTYGAETDYERILMVHDWVAEHFFYDYDFLEGRADDTEWTTADVLRTRKGVCTGFSAVATDLLRALDIPCREIYGYALGIGSTELSVQDWIEADDANHVWAEAYADGRWVLFDATWDSDNSYRDGTYLDGGLRNRKYFDCTPEMMAFDRKTLFYEELPQMKLKPLNAVLLPETWREGDAFESLLPETQTLLSYPDERDVPVAWMQKAELCHDGVFRIQGLAELTKEDLVRYGYNRIPTEIYVIVDALPGALDEDYAWLAEFLREDVAVQEEPEVVAAEEKPEQTGVLSGVGAVEGKKSGEPAVYTLLFIFIVVGLVTLGTVAYFRYKTVQNGENERKDRF